MKKRFLFLAFCLILCISVLCCAASRRVTEGLFWCDLQESAGDSVTVMDVPSFERGDVVTILKQHVRFYEHTYVTNYKGELWCRIFVGPIGTNNISEGYIPAYMVQRQQCPDGNERGPVRWGSGNGAVNFDGTKLRKAPNSESDILEVMKTDDQCFVLARVLVGDNTWYRVMRNRTIGYINGTFLDVKPDVWGHLPVERR